jgi:transcriptional regulator with XRE-family HTH domain
VGGRPDPRGYGGRMDPNVELGDFLRSRREQTRPDLLEEQSVVPRRVPGLRREELARLAGVSVDYYTRLEQGRRITPSDGVLDAIGTALGLDGAERQYITELARARTKPPRRSPAAQAVLPGLLHLMDTFADMPAYVLGRRSDILAANQMARVLLADFPAMPARQRSAARWVLLDEGARSVYRNWEEVASDIVGWLRLDAASRPGDPRTGDLVDELEAKSPEFRKCWASRRVVTRCGGKVLHHPRVGELEFQVEALRAPDDEEQTLFVYLPKLGSRSQEALADLACCKESPARECWPRPVGGLPSQRTR